MKKYEKILANILSLTIIICGIVGNYSASKVNAEIKDEYYKESIMTGDLSINWKKIKNENQNQNISKLSDGIVYQYENSDERELEFSENSEGEKFKFTGNIYSKNNYDMRAADTNFSGNLMTEKDIKIDGQKLIMDNAILYSKNGNIIINGNSYISSGIIYAPNGNVEINCQQFTCQGVIISKAVKINASILEIEKDNTAINKLKNLEQYKLPKYKNITMFYDNNTGKIGIEDIEYQKINLFTRFDDESFKKVSGYKNGMEFKFREGSKYFEAYAEYTDKFGQKYLSQVETFQSDKEGGYSPVQRDENKDGIQDAYDDIVMDSGDVNETIELSLDEKTYNKINKYDSIIQKKVENNVVKYIYHLKRGDDIEKYYDSNGNKVIKINNILYLRKVVEMSGNTYSLYIYNKDGDLYAKCAYDGKNQIYNEYNYGKKGLKTVKHNGVEYKYGYTDGEVTKLSINDKMIYERKSVSTNNTSITMANGYDYNLITDEIGNVTDYVENGTKKYSWKYDADDHYKLTRCYDNVNNVIYNYKYNDEDEIIAEQLSDGFSIQKDINGYEWDKKIKYNGEILEEKYRTDLDTYIYSVGDLESYQNKSEKNISFKGSTILKKQYFSQNDSEKIINEFGKKICYKYNEYGLLYEITENGSVKENYEYNNLMELVREDNKDAGKTYIYEYDGGGNIVAVKSFNYSYGIPANELNKYESQENYFYNDKFKDQLIRVRGKDITYDDVGNPIRYMNKYSMKWSFGNKLSEIDNESGKKIAEYKYDMNGRRVCKNTGDSITKYYYDEDKLILQKNDKEAIWFNYDVYGIPIGFKYNGVQYIYNTDEQGSITGIYNTAGKKIVEYIYNGWGEIVNQSGDKEIAQINPLRYRGYYYDEESGFYYLNNRYYASSIKRMINMDRYTDTGFGMFSHNMYAYCENTPVNASNYSGNVPTWVTKHSKSPSGKNYYWKYITNNSDINCYAYAVDLSKRKDPGEACGYKFSYNFTESYIRDLVIKDLNNRKYECRKISPSDVRTVTSDWKLIAIRTGKSNKQGIGNKLYQDYHVMRRRYKDGAFWGHKPGTASAVLIYNGDPIKAKTWNGDEYDGGWGDTTYRYTSSICLVAYR